MRLILASVLLLMAAPALAVDVPSHSEQKPNLTILADENLMLPLAQIARVYGTAEKTPLTIILKNAAEAQDQIEQGLEAHVMLTQNDGLIERLAAQGLTDVSSTKPFARTRLALVTINGNAQALVAKRISFAAMIYTTPDLPVLVDGADTADGARAQKLLAGYEFSTALKARVQVKQTHEEVLEAMHDQPSLALLLAADAVAQPDVTVLNVLPAEVSPPVTYRAVVLASESMGEAKQFTLFLASRQAQEIFAHYGFEAAN